jgi:uncharacterized protein YbaP (TraB family)
MRILASVALLTSLALAPGSTSAQNPAAPARVPGSTLSPQDLFQGSATAPKRGVFYVVDGASSRLFLFGTLHLGKPEFYPLNAAVIQALAASSQLYLELDFSNLGDIKGMKDASEYPTGVTLESQLPPALMQKLEAAFKRYGVTKDQFNGKRPWAVVDELLSRKALELGYDPAYSTDIYFAVTATLLNKRILGLETVDEQAGLLNGMSKTEQQAYVEDMLSSLEEQRAPKELEAFVDAWARADRVALEANLDKARSETPPALEQVKQRIFDDRNVKMAERIDAILRSGTPTFVAVGAGHLVGQNNIVDLLRKRGFTVREL